jgi:hypothetical protein
VSADAAAADAKRQDSTTTETTAPDLISAFTFDEPFYVSMRSLSASAQEINATQPTGLL